LATDVTGVVVHFDSEDGYGFISPSQSNDDNFDFDQSEDLFFHITEHPDRRAEETQRLRFDVTKGSDGLKAVNIRHTNSSQTEPWDDTFASKRPRWGK
jgi:cold shock CspA family protein